jgi:hypothetical protein
MYLRSRLILTISGQHLNGSISPAIENVLKKNAPSDMENAPKKKD